VVFLIKYKMKTMTSKKMLVSFLAMFALVVLSIVSVSAASFGTISGLEVAEVDANAAQPIAVFAGDTIPVRVFFESSDDAEDVRVKAWITGEREFAVVTERFDVIAGNTYSRLLAVKVPSTLDEEDLDEALELVVVVENKNDGEADEFTVDLTLQRESYVVEILDVDMVNEVSAGDVLAVDVILKNRGRQFAEDTFVVVRIPALEIEDRAYFGDLSPQDEPIVNGRQLRNEDDSGERRLFLRIPSSVPAGVYVVEVDAFNDDSVTTVTRKVAISGSEDTTMVVAPVHSKTFDAGQTVEYSMVLVNSGSRLSIFELVVESPASLNVQMDEPIAVVPAGSSKTVKFLVTADKIGTHNFAVNVHSGAELIQRESFTANVQGNDIVAGSPTVLLTVVLAVIFIVLLIVLIVLLTRKPERSEEFGESYY
jgi:hypothetical protein